ncbi:MAG: hypothetical protein RLZZ505_2495 [Verrucomicrobiota bacterium]|jgi:hypothetical protein
MTRLLLLAAIFVSPLSELRAQLATSLSMNKKNYVAGEPVIAEIIVTNHSGRELTLASSRALPWLSFVVTNTKGNPVPTRKLNVFGAMKIKAGESLAKRVNLNEFFLLDHQGNFAASAVVRDPTGAVQSASTNRILFNLSPGRLFWSQKIGVSNNNTSHTRELKLITFSDGQKTQLYAQVIDGRTGTSITTFPLGDALMLRKPMVTLDKKQRMHVMFLSTPSMWVHCQVSADGKLVGRDFHQRAAQGDPILMAYGDGSVRVVNSVVYDPKAVEAERSKIRKATDRPEIPLE